MTEDQKLADLLTGCLADLIGKSPESTARTRDALQQIEEVAPGEIEAMASRLQLRRLTRTTAH